MADRRDFALSNFLTSTTNFGSSSYTPQSLLHIQPIQKEIHECVPRYSAGVILAPTYQLLSWTAHVPAFGIVVSNPCRPPRIGGAEVFTSREHDCIRELLHSLKALQPLRPMALWSDASSVIFEAMENDSSPKQGVKISDKVIHARADIRIESIENAPQDYTVALQSPKLVEQDSQSLEDAAEKERAAEMQVWWDEAISRNMNLPDGYQSVAVLLIKWDDELDELKTRKEACSWQTSH